MALRELTAEEVLLVAGGLSDGTITVTGPGGGGGWGGDGPPSDPWGGGGPPNEPVDNGGGGGDGSGGQHYTLADVNHDGQYNEHVYKGDDGHLYYSVKDANGHATLYPITQITVNPGSSGASAQSSLGATGTIPSANVTYTDTTSSGTFSYQVDATHPRNAQ